MGLARRVAVPQAVVSRLWPGETVVCVASGPSLTDDDVQYCRGKARVIVVNDNYTKAPWADALFASDLKWWAYHEGVPSFQGLKFSLGATWTPQAIENDGQRWGVQVLKCGRETGLSLQPDTLAHGQNGGYQAINLAVLLGASRIILLGYDLQLGPHGQEHWFGQHPRGIRRDLPGAMPTWPAHFATLVEPLQQAGVAIINATRQTVLTCFPRESLEAVL